MQKYAVLLIFWKNFASANFPESVFSNDFTSTKILQQKIHFVFVDVLECVGLLSRHKTDLKVMSSLTSILCLGNKTTRSERSTKTQCIFCWRLNLLHRKSYEY